MGRYNVIHPYNRILTINKEWSTDTCGNTDESWNHVESQGGNC